MPVPISDSMQLNAPVPDFTRQEYATIASLKAVRDARMPQMYIAYCLEDHAYYYYSQQNDVDPTTGRWRQFIGIATVVQEMPSPSPKYASVLLQYIGATTQDYTKGYFYGLTTGTGDITTVDAMKALIEGQSTKVTLDYYGETSVVKCYENSGTDYFVYNGTIYSGVPDAGVITFNPAEATSYTTDEAVAALNITGATYGWENVPVSPGGDAEDKLTWGIALPQTAEDGEPFLYMGPDVSTYEVATGLTPVDNPQALGLYESDGSGGYELSTDTTASVNLYCWYNGSEQLYTLTETPEVGDSVWRDDGSSGYESAGTVTEYDSTEGIKASDASFDSFYGRFAGSDVTGKVYYELAPTLVCGTIYQYDEANTQWVPKSAAGDVASIPIADIEEMFD